MKNLIIFCSLIVLIAYSCKSDKTQSSANVEKVDQDSIYQFVDDLPRFPGCESLVDEKQRKTCADSLLLHYLYTSLKYPQYAVDNNIQGRCVVSFVVEKDGSVSNPKITKDIGGGCGEAAVAVVNNMNTMKDKWTPGKVKGIPQRVFFNLPVSFRIEEKKTVQ